MTIHAGYLVDLRNIRLDENADSGSTWIQAMPLGTYEHPIHGTIDITPERVQRFAANVNSGVRDTDLDIDYDHKATGGEAAGWVRQAEARSDGLWVLVEWTKSAYGKIKEKAYRYFSPEFVDEWKHPKTNVTYKDVLFGGGITNRPFLKDILPINMTEVVNASGGKSMDPAEVLKQIAKELGLPEDTDPAVLLGHVQAQKKAEEGEGQNDQTDANQGSQGQDQSQAGTNAQGQPQQIAASEKKDEKVVQLDEKALMEVPFVKQLMETVTSQGKKLDEDAVKADVVKLSEKAAEKKVVLPPTVKQDLEKQLSDMTPAQRPGLIKLMEGLIENGQLGVKLGEDGHSGSGGGGGTDATKKFDEAVQKKLSENEGMSFADAAIAVADDSPQLYTEYQRELASA